MGRKVELVDFDGPNAWLNLAREEYLLLHRQKQPEDIFLIFYENLPSIILGRSLDYQKEVYAGKKHPPVIRRLSGGGTVNHFRGNLNYGLLLNIEANPGMININQSYEIILQALVNGFGKVVALERQGISDLCLWQSNSLRKISGNAQVRKRGWLLHHGTFLYDLAGLTQVKNFLRPPEKQPDYRRNRSHSDFMVRALKVRSLAMLKLLIANSFAKEFKRDLVKKELNPKADFFIRQQLLPKYLFKEKN